MNHLKRQLEFVKLLSQREHERIKKNPQKYADGMSTTLQGLLAVERTLGEMVELEQAKAIISLPNHGDLAFKEIGQQRELNTDTRPFWLQFIDDRVLKKKKRKLK